MEAEEPIAGTAQHARTVVFIGYPKQHWASNHLRSRGLPVHVAEYLAGLKGDPRRVAVRFFDFRDAEKGKTSLIICPQMKRIDDVPLDDLPRLLEDVFDRGGVGQVGEALPGRHIFICTHGVRDMCCAKFGFGAVRRLRGLLKADYRLGQDVSVWETTHLVGDRFAGTGIVFPQGHMYGHLCAETAAEWLAAIDHGKIDLPRYRGSVFLPQKHQAVEAGVHAACDAVADVHMAETPSDEQITVIVTLENGETRRAIAHLQCRRYDFFSSCQHVVDRKASKKNRWVVTRIVWDAG